MNIPVALFWTALSLLVYTYLLFPIALLLRGILRPRPYRSDDITPPVSLIIAAHNEASVIAAKLENLLALDYPRNQLEIIVASDGSDDGTDDVVRRYSDEGMQLLSLPRQGKASALNAAVAAATGEILVFSDANSIYARDALRKLLRPFADPAVGGVAGNQRYQSAGKTENSGPGEKSYWRFDRRLKQFQSQAGNATSATGAIYAIRRALFRPVPAGVTDDFYTSVGVMDQGYRLVFALDAVAYEPVAAKHGVEWGRKVRIITRGLYAVLLMRRLLNPFRHGFYAVQLFSHKVLRRAMIFPLLLLLLVSPFLWRRGWFYRLVTLAQCGIYGCGLIGLLGGKRLERSKIFGLPFYFCFVNAACVVATLNVLRGHRIVVWNPQRLIIDEKG